MTDLNRIHGLTAQGSTRQTIALARELYKNREARNKLRDLLDLFEKPQTYSGQDGDNRQHMAHALAGMMRDSGVSFNY